jgi:hypothetical protein
MYLPVKVRVTEAAAVPPGPATLLIEILDENDDVLDTSTPIPQQPGQPITYDGLCAKCELGTTWGGLPTPLTPTDAKPTPVVPGKHVPLSGSVVTPPARK